MKLNKYIEQEIDKLLEARLSMKLPEYYIENDYSIIKGDFSNSSKWKTKVLINNNGHDLNIGDMDKVGYIFIGSKTNTFIPIARSDEHQQGYELYYEKLKKKVPKDDYVAIFNSGDIYWYPENDSTEAVEKENKLLLSVIKLWLDNNGDNGRIIISNRGRIEVDLRSFLKVGGYEFVDKAIRLKRPVDSLGRTLRPISDTGMYLIGLLENMSIYSLNVIKNKQKILRLAMSISYFIDITLSDLKLSNLEKVLKPYTEVLSKAVNSKDIDTIVNIVLGYPSIKNSIHSLLKEKHPEMLVLFINTAKALEEFNIMGSIKR